MKSNGRKFHVLLHKNDCQYGLGKGPVLWYYCSAWILLKLVPGDAEVFEVSDNEDKIDYKQTLEFAYRHSFKLDDFIQIEAMYLNRPEINWRKLNNSKLDGNCVRVWLKKEVIAKSLAFYNNGKCYPNYVKLNWNGEEGEY